MRHKAKPIDENGERECSKCGETYPATAEFFYADKRRQCGLRSACKACVGEYPRSRK